MPNTDAYFGQHQTAEYLSGLFTSFDVLVDNPRLGCPWGKKGIESRRRYVYRSHYIFYRFLDDKIIITDIKNTRMALPREE